MSGLGSTSGFGCLMVFDIRILLGDWRRLLPHLHIVHSQQATSQVAQIASRQVGEELATGSLYLTLSAPAASRILRA
jgi:hypothetical protein